jgi:hypothetical protein
MADSPELAEARAAVEAAIKNFISIYSEEVSDENPYVTGWIAYAEYITTETVTERKSRSRNITPDDQSIATSLGLLHLGMESFNITRG